MYDMLVHLDYHGLNDYLLKNSGLYLHMTNEKLGWSSDFLDRTDRQHPFDFDLREEETYEIPNDNNPSEGVIQAVALTKGVEVTEVGPLNNDIDADALNDLLQSGKPGNPTVTFTFAGCEVEVQQTSTVRVQELPRTKS